MHQTKRIIKSGINTAIICSRCGKKVGTVTLKSKVKWRTIRWAVGLGLLFEIIANVVVYMIFQFGR